ncbi:FMN-dependent NADH-azoreductase [Verrucomicrobium sp. GAS474]|uniref:FMN-dependent NADH-azoreductase n=1 Tax=Verrucomicrobium sp. GAS474 TaxID=1882831 RepID=UPI00087A788F|nr:NAD(P)H-dependent oxidoreductase [Verrucomicrobium sp. GAS474]SDT88343.1 FMN-dependent NADH-azoreductase [Verrucomicrobium sp. GAS474]
MSKVLHISASPRGERSASTTVARHFLDAYLAAHPGDTVETLDLWTANLPEFDGAALDAKYAILHGQPFTPEQAAAWTAIVSLAEQFKAADKFVFSLPMWNFGIPYKLKQWIDLIAQPGLTFSFSPETGYTGLVTGKPAVAVYARGGAYGPGTGAEGYDAQTTYFRQVLGFVGVTDLREILVEPTLAGGEAKDAAVAVAKGRADEIAHTF